MTMPEEGWTQEFKCPICEQKFGDLGEMKGHIVDLHKIDPNAKVFKKFDKMLTKLAAMPPEKLMQMAIKAGQSGKPPKVVQKLMAAGEKLKAEYS